MALFYLLSFLSGSLAVFLFGLIKRSLKKRSESKCTDELGFLEIVRY